jgi:hypothetical protein
VQRTTQGVHHRDCVFEDLHRQDLSGRGLGLQQAPQQVDRLLHVAALLLK